MNILEEAMRVHDETRANSRPAAFSESYIVVRVSKSEKQLISKSLGTNDQHVAAVVVLDQVDCGVSITA